MRTTLVGYGTALRDWDSDGGAIVQTGGECEWLGTATMAHRAPSLMLFAVHMVYCITVLGCPFLIYGYPPPDTAGARANLNVIR